MRLWKNKFHSIHQHLAAYPNTPGRIFKQQERLLYMSQGHGPKGDNETLPKISGQINCLWALPQDCPNSFVVFTFLCWVWLLCGHHQRHLFQDTVEFASSWKSHFLPCFPSSSQTCWSCSKYLWRTLGIESTGGREFNEDRWGFFYCHKAKISKNHRWKIQLGIKKYFVTKFHKIKRAVEKTDERSFFLLLCLVSWLVDWLV